MFGTVDSILFREVFFIQSVFYREVPLYSSYIVTHCWPILLLGGWVDLIESTNDLNQSMKNNWAHWAADMSVAQKLTITLHISLWCSRGSCYGINWTGMLLSNHVARRYIAVSCVDLESICQSQNVFVTDEYLIHSNLFGSVSVPLPLTNWAFQIHSFVQQ